MNYLLDTNAVVALLRLSWQDWTAWQRSVRVDRQRIASSLPRLARFVLRMTVLPGRILEESNSGGRKVKVDAPRRAVTLDEVRAQRDEIVQLGRRFGVRNIRVFGSVARGEATADSDLDLLVDVDRGHGYLDMAGFAIGVEDTLGVFTQVATPRGLKLRIRDRVLREAVVL